MMMSQEFHAIYEHGILRPLTPLNLPEATEVEVTLRLAAAETNSAAQNGAELRLQKEALQAMFAEVDKLPQTPHNDGLSGRDHDHILYGSPK
jgi:predicted DNA-binding antitoxin AbrB/MazE fold protein